LLSFRQFARTLASALAAATAVFATTGFGLRAPDALPSSAAAAGVPNVVLWAWERPEDLRFLDPHEAGVAFLAKTIYLRPADATTPALTPPQFSVRPRLQPLRVAANAPLIAVVRIESLPGRDSVRDAPVPQPQDRERIATAIAALQDVASVRAIQIDFDATTTQRAFYASLLLDVRRKLPPALPLSITALASWCIGDPWIAQLPAGTIDEAVPMLFRMGPDAGVVTRFLHSGKNFDVAACQNSFGISTDEPHSKELLTKSLFASPGGPPKKRIYVFAPRAWTPAAANSILQEWQP
jgi:hypothetical protein